MLFKKLINVNLADKGPQEIKVYPKDEAEGLAREFCKKHKIVDKQKQYKLLKMLETKIKDHRYPKGLPEDKLQRPDLDPKVREDCYKIFNDVWYDFDEENGQEIKKAKYL